MAGRGRSNTAFIGGLSPCRKEASTTSPAGQRAPNRHNQPAVSTASTNDGTNSPTQDKPRASGTVHAGPS